MLLALPALRGAGRDRGRAGPPALGQPPSRHRQRSDRGCPGGMCRGWGGRAAMVTWSARLGWPRGLGFAPLTVSFGVIWRVCVARVGGRRHRGHVGGGSGPSRDLLAGTSGRAARVVPEVAPGGDGTRLFGKCRGAADGRGAALPVVRRGAGAVGARAAAAGGDAAGLEEFWPRRGRCRGCGRTHVLLPADLWSRRRYGAAVIMAVLVLAAQAAAAGRAAARPWLAVPGGAGGWCQRRRPGRGGRGSMRGHRCCGSS